MIIYPAIDLRDGNVVRLHKGAFDEETVYGSDPVDVANQFVSQGAQWIHVVDLDAAKTGIATNLDVIQKIAETVGVPVQSGGGVRSKDAAMRLIDAGVSRVVIGTAALENPELVEALASECPTRIAVGLDAREGMVATRGWQQSSDVSVLDLVKRFEAAGVAAFIVTDIERDGTLDGPDVSGLRNVLQITDVDVIASGGVGKVEDVTALAQVEVGGKRLAGVVMGKAIYEQTLTVARAIEAAR